MTKQIKQRGFHWVKDIPEKEGYYWLYSPSQEDDIADALFVVELVRDDPKDKELTVYRCSCMVGYLSAFLNDCDNMEEIWWCPAIVPEPPALT